MKEIRTEEIRKISKAQIGENEPEIQIDMNVTVTRITSRSELLANKYSLERDLESLKSSVAEIENKLKYLDALIARVEAEMPPV